MKILVTGSTGFLGSNILLALKDTPNVEVIAVCRDPKKLPDFFKGEVRTGDLINEDYRRSVLQNIDVV